MVSAGCCLSLRPFVAVDPACDHDEGEVGSSVGGLGEWLEDFVGV